MPELLAAGESQSQIVLQLRRLTPEDLLAWLAYASHLAHEFRAYPLSAQMRIVVEYRRLAGYHLPWAGNDLPSYGDRDAGARRGGSRILFTVDRDFPRIHPEASMMRKDGFDLTRVHPAKAGQVEKLVCLVIEKGGSPVGRAVLVYSRGINILPVGRNEAGFTH